jgi:hypothetical protein
MTPEYYDALNPALQKLADQIEEHCGFEIEVTWTRSLAVRGMLSHSPTSITIHHREILADPAVICHELCHAERYFVLGVPIMRMVPARKIFGPDGVDLDAAVNLDNMLEHIIILKEMEQRFGFSRDSTHVRNDLSSYPKWSKDGFSRRCFALCNAALVHFNFAELARENDYILRQEALTLVAQDLTFELASCLDSKPRMVASLVRALGLNEDEVHLFARNCSKACDVGAPLRQWLDEGKRNFQPN